MNICLISQEYPPETNWGGIATYTQVLARQLVAIGHRVHVISLAEGDECINDDMGVTVHRVSRTSKGPIDQAAFPEVAGVSHWSLSFSQRVYEQVQEIHQEEPIDVIEAPETCAQALVTFRLLHGIKKVTRLHTPFFWIRHLNEIAELPEHLVRDSLEKMQTDLSTIVTSPTVAMADVVEKQWNTQNIVVVPNFFNLKTYTPDLSVFDQHLKGLQYILFFGRLEVRKGVRVLAQALPEVLQQHENLVVVFIGSDSVLNSSSMKEQLQESLADYRERVLFIDNISHSSLYPIIERAKFVVLPSAWENFPYACIEAMALGKTVVTSNSGGFPEIIDDGAEGLLCPPNDAAALRERILECLEHADIAGIGSRAKAKVKVFDTATIVNRMVEVYESISAPPPLRIAYILLHIPYPSETFIINEILALQALGTTIYPVSLVDAANCHETLVSRLAQDIFDVAKIEDLAEAAAKTRYETLAKEVAAELAVPGKYADVAAIVAEHVDCLKVDHLHAHFAAEASIVALLVSKLTGIPFSFTAHAYDLFNVNKEATGGLGLKERLSILLPAAQKVITISDFNKRYLLDKAGDAHAGKIEIVRCGIDPERFSLVQRASKETVTLLCVGRLVEKKGHEFLFRAFKKACEAVANMELRLVGDGYLRERLEKLAVELDLKDKVIFLGDISSDAVNEEMRNSDIFVLHSITAESGDMEGIPVSIMEAAATGLPVLSTRHSGIAELVIDSRTGLLSDEKDVDALACQIVTLTAAPEVRWQMGREGRVVVKEKFNLTQENRKLNDLFRSMVFQAPRLNIAFLTNMLSSPAGGGGNVHVHQVANLLLARGHRLYTNLAAESDAFTKWSEQEFASCGEEIDIFYIRLHGHPGNDELTLFRNHNASAPCIWEVNAPLEELLTNGMSSAEVAKLTERRKELAHLVDAAICVSAEMESYAREVLGIRTTFVIPNGSDPDRFSPDRRKKGIFGKDTFTVIWCGSPQYSWQGYRIVEEAAKKMEAGGRDVLFALTAEGTSTKNIRYLGRVPYETMPEYIASSDAALCIYGDVSFYSEFFFSPLKLYDYMACGVPVIGSDLGQISSTLSAYECGVVSDTSVDDLIAKIEYLKNNPATAREMGARGRKAVLQHRNWTKIVSETEQVMYRLKREKQTIKASVVICTYNRCDLLAASLRAVIDQDLPPQSYEIVVVDNNSSDDTRAVTESMVASSPVRIKYVFETRQGLSFARNAGIENAEGEIVAFVDDDIDAEPQWLRSIVAAFCDANVACAGGPIRPVWPSERPAWLSDDWAPYLTINEFEAARKTGSYTWPDTPWGANISFRKSVFETIGLFPTNLGRIGTSLLSNEEVNICKKMAEAGMRIAFAPEAVIHHKIDPQRVTKQWFYHRTYWQGRSDAILDAASQTGSYDWICQRMRRYIDVAAKEGAGSFTARCARKIALGYLFGIAFAGTDEKSTPALRALNRYLDQLGSLPPTSQGAARSLPVDTSTLSGKAILVVDYEVPQFDKYAGSRTTFMYLKLLVELGMKVYFLPDDFEKREPYSSELEAMDITLLQGEWYRENWQRWIMENATNLHYVLFNRPNITVSYIDFIKAHTNCVILFQGHDLHYLRLSRKYEVDGDIETLREAEEYKKIEFDIIHKSDVTLTYSDYERQLLADACPGERIHSVPLFFYEQFPEGRQSFAGRKDIMFVGGCGHKPNLDAILWFAREIFPKVLAEVPDAVLHVIGTYPPQEVRDLESANIRILGHVSEQELEEYYRRIRMAVIPLRFGAGVKGKTVEALRNGLPIVSTAIGLEGIPGIGTVTRPADSAEEFANEVVALYRDEKRLELTSALYREYAKATFNSFGAKRTLAEILLSVPPREGAPVHKTEPERTTPRLIAMYLPQYHPIPENDEWWGKGFTEWRNVSKTKPLFKGHYQPHVPADLGFYDLRVEETRIAQAELARQYGVHGFCYYHYWFNGKRLLERPLEEVLRSGKPDFPFCICWANENWTRRWDGEEQHVLMKQVYSEEDDRNHIRDLFRFFNDRRYIRVNGKPMFLVYRTENIPNPKRTAEIWREAARKAGIGELYLVRVESIGGCDPASIGFDAALEFAPDWQKKGPRIMPKQDSKLPGVDLLNEVYKNNYVHYYDKLADEMMAKPAVAYKRFRCATPSWDNSARRQEGANIFVGSTPEKYRQWLEHVVSYTRKTFKGDEQIAFVNAWNEWAEGNHLEPDQKYGRAYLEATKNVVDGAYEVPLQPAVQEVDLSQYQQELLALQQQLAAVQKEKEELERAAAALKEKLAEKDEQVAAREARIEDLLKSASWRVTEPLRKAYEVAQKIQGKK